MDIDTRLGGDSASARLAMPGLLLIHLRHTLDTQLPHVEMLVQPGLAPSNMLFLPPGSTDCNCHELMFWLNDVACLNMV